MVVPVAAIIGATVGGVAWRDNRLAGGLVGLIGGGILGSVIASSLPSSTGPGGEQPGTPPEVVKTAPASTLPPEVSTPMRPPEPAAGFGMVLPHARFNSRPRTRGDQSAVNGQGTSPFGRMQSAGFGQDSPPEIEPSPEAIEGIKTSLAYALGVPAVASVVGATAGAVAWKEHRVIGGVLGFFGGGLLGSVVGGALAVNEIKASVVPELETLAANSASPLVLSTKIQASPTGPVLSVKPFAPLISTAIAKPTSAPAIPSALLSAAKPMLAVPPAKSSTAAVAKSPAFHAYLAA